MNGYVHQKTDTRMFIYCSLRLGTPQIEVTKEIMAYLYNEIGYRNKKEQTVDTQNTLDTSHTCFVA